MAGGHRRGEVSAWPAGDLRDRVGDAAQDFPERHRLIVILADIHRVPAGPDRVGGQRRGEVARGTVDRPVADGQQAVTGLDSLAGPRLAALAVVMPA